MSNCPLIVAETHPDYVLSNYGVTSGSVVEIFCRGFAKQYDGNTPVTCTNGNWVPTFSLNCKTELDEKERIYLGIGLACAVLVIIAVTWICCYCCCCHGGRGRNKYYYKYGPGRWNRSDTWRNRYVDDGRFIPDIRESRKSAGNGYIPRQSFRETNVYTTHHDEIRRGPSFRETRRDFNDVDIGRSRRDEYDFGRSRRDEVDFGRSRREDVDIGRTRRDSLITDRLNNLRNSQYFAGDRPPSVYGEPSNYGRTRHLSYDRQRSMYSQAGDFRRSRHYSYNNVDDIRRSRRYSDADDSPPYRDTVIRRTRRYSDPEIRYVDLPRTEVKRIEYEPEVRRIYKTERPAYEVIHIKEERPREEIIRVVDTEPLYKTSRFSGYTQDPVVIEEVMVDSPTYVKELPARLKPMVLNDDTIYLKYETNMNNRSNYSLNGTVPRAKIIELDDVDGGVGNSVIPYSVTGNNSVDQTTNYFLGRQDFPFKSRRTASQRELDHVLYHGKGKVTEIFEEESGNRRKSRILSSNQMY